MAKKILIVADIKEGESLLPILSQFEEQIGELNETNSKLTKRLSECEGEILELTERIEGIESAPSPEPKRELKSHADLMRIELKELENDPEPHIEKRVSFGVSRENAAKAIEQRKTFIRSELGIKMKAAGKKVAGAASLILMLFVLLGNAFAADQQGYPSTYGAPTNWWTILTNGTAEPLAYIPFRKDSGLGISQTFLSTGSNLVGTVVSYGYPSTDGTNFNWLQPWTLLTGTFNNTNGVVTSITNFNANQLRGFAGMFLMTTNTSATNAIIQGQITNTYVVNLQTNNNTNVSAGLLWNRPN
jgi:hypothetical protein